MVQDSLQALSILMVVPSLLQGKLLAKSLAEHTDVDIRQCSNIEQAIIALKDAKPDLVISAMYFNDGDGIDLLNHILKDKSLEHILFMLASSEERFEVLDPILQAGIVAVLPKPFKAADIQNALDKTVVYLADNARQKNHIALSSMAILLVDDSRLARRHVLKLLVKAGLNEAFIQQAENGQQACELLRQQHFDLVLTDYNMPIMDGEQLLIHIRKQNEQGDMPVIMITSERCEHRLKSIKENGVTALLDKPFDPRVLKELLETCV